MDNIDPDQTGPLREKIGLMSITQRKQKNGSINYHSVQFLLSLFMQ